MMEKLNVSIWERLEYDEQLKIMLYKQKLITKEYVFAFVRLVKTLIERIARICSGVKYKEVK
jgi:hypothetical protein